MSRDSCRCLHLFQPIVEIHMCNTVLWGVVVRITFAFVILDLEAGWYSFVTEGNLIPSAAAFSELWYQVELISSDCFAHHLSQSQGLRIPSMPKLHHPLVVGVITNHVDVYDILDRA